MCIWAELEVFPTYRAIRSAASVACSLAFCDVDFVKSGVIVSLASNIYTSDKTLALTVEIRRKDGSAHWYENLCGVRPTLYSYDRFC